MQQYHCDVCQSYFRTKQHYERHILTRKHLLRADESKVLHTCTQCSKTFVHASGLSKHKSQCTGPQNGHMIETFKEEMKEMRAAFEEERSFYKDEIAKMLDRYVSNPPTTTHNTTNNIDTQQNNFHIHINAFGHENLDYLTDSLLAQCVNRVYDSVPTLIERIHFDPKHPENHNFKITNKKLPHACVIGTDNKWRLMNKEEAISTMVDNGYQLIDTKFKEDPSLFTEERRRQYRRFQDNYDNDEKETMKRLKNDVELVVLNGTREIFGNK
jgi:hypothetical protein